MGDLDKYERLYGEAKIKKITKYARMRHPFTGEKLTIAEIHRLTLISLPNLKKILLIVRK